MWTWTVLALVAIAVPSVPAWEEDDVVVSRFLGFGRHGGPHWRKHHPRLMHQIEAEIHPTWQDYVDGVTSLMEDPNFREELSQHEAEYKAMMEESDANEKYDFPCEYDHSSHAGQRPHSVHELTASDIEIVGALGDSITAGNGINALSLVEVRTQYRGFSWSVGGEVGYTDGSTTVPNVLKYFNPDVTGFSLNNGKADEYPSARMNAAVPGSIARDLPDQARALVSLLQERNEDQDQWKLVTLFIGGNDLCRFCNNPEVLSAENYAGYIKEALDILERDLKRVFVSVVGMFDVTPLGSIKKGLVCRQIDPLLCPCGTNAAEKAGVEQAVKDYNKEVVKMLDAATRLTTRKDFTVVYQPVMTENDVPRKADGNADLSYLAPDCFHFSRKGHNAIAKFLWKALFEPVGSKSTKTAYDIELYCPEKGEYLRTQINSQAGWKPEEEMPSEVHPEVDSGSLDSGPDYVSVEHSAWHLPVFYITVASVAFLLVGLVAIIIGMLMRKPQLKAVSYSEKDTQPLVL